MTVVEFQHVKPGKGGAFVRTKLKNYRTGAVLERTFRADEKVPLAVIDKREMQFLYREGDDYVFMDNETYDQLHVAPHGARRRGRTTSRRATPPSCRCTRTRSSASTCPRRSSSTVTETEPGIQGDRVSGARKPATLETGLVVQVPLFVERRASASRSTPAPASTWPAPERADDRGRHRVDAARGPRAGARPRVRARAARRSTPTSCSASSRSPPDEYAQRARARRRGAPRRDRRAAPQVLRALGARAHAVDRPHAAAPRRATSWAGMPEVPTAVVISEAVELAKQYSTKDSGRFVNGLLSRIAEAVRPSRVSHRTVSERGRHRDDHRSGHRSRSCSTTSDDHRSARGS